MTTLDILAAGARGWSSNVKAARTVRRQTKTTSPARRARTWNLERLAYRVAAFGGFVAGAYEIYHPAAFIVGAIGAVIMEQTRDGERGE